MKFKKSPFLNPLFLVALATPLLHGATLDQRNTGIWFDAETLDRMQQRGSLGQAIFQRDDVVGVILKTTPVPGSRTGMGGYLSLYLPAGVQVVEADYLQPNAAGGQAAAPIKGPAVAPLGSGPVAASTTAGLIGLNVGPNLFGAAESAVTSSGLHRGTIAGLYADTGIFYAVDPRTSWQSFTSSGGFDGNVATNDNLLTNSLGEARQPVTKWDAMQLIAFGLSVPAPALADPNARGNLPWGTGSVVAGPETAYPMAFDRDYWLANATNANRLRNSFSTGPWRRISYAGSQAAKDVAGLQSSVTGMVGANAAGIGHDFQINAAKAVTDLLRYGNPLPATTSLTDAISPKALRFSVGGLELSRPEHVRVRLRILASRGEPGAPFDASGGLALNSDAFSSDEGGESGGREHAWRSYDPTTASINTSALLQLTGSKSTVAVNEVFSYRLTAGAGGTAALTGAGVTVTLPVGITFLSANPPPASLVPLRWNFGTLHPSNPATGQPIRNVQINVRAAQAGDYFPTARLTASGGVDVTASESTAAGRGALLVTSLTASPAFATAGSTIACSLTVSNHGASSSSSPLVIKHRLPAGFTYTAHSGGQINGATLPLASVKVAALVPAEPMFTISQSIQPGKSLVFNFTALITSAAPVGTHGQSFSVTQNGRVISSPSLGLVSVGGGRVGSTVWRDWDGNGLQESGEEGISGAEVELRYAGANGTFGNADDVITRMTTNASGGYLFAGLAAGNYRVSLTAANFANGGTLKGCRATGDADGVGSANQSTTSLVINGSQLAQNFGYQFNPADSTAVSIGDVVYSDANNNGAEDLGEGGIPEITVDLYEDTAGNGVMDAGDVKITTVSTADGLTDDLDGDGEIDTVGFYIFRGLDPSRKYIADVDAEDPDFMVAFGSPGSQSSPDKLACGDFATGSCATADFGFFSGPPASIGDQVFIDHNFDAVYNSGDLPIAGLVMELFIDTNGDGIANETRRAATTTDETGKYRFSNLGSASYLIRFSTLDPAIPAGTTALVIQRAANIVSGQDYNDGDFHFVRLLNKSTNMPAVRAGETLTYTLEPNIPGSRSVSNLVVSDSLPTGTIYAGAATPSPSAAPTLGGTGTVEWNLGSTVPAAPGAIVSPGYNPTSVVQTTTAQVVDTFVSQGNPTSIEGTGAELKTKPQAGAQKAALMSFVLPPLASTDVIDRAVVRLTVSSARSANHTVSLRALNTAWTEAAAVWNDSDGTGTGDWATAGVFGTADYGTISYGSYNAPYLVGQTLEFDVTSLVRGWRDGTIPNRGVALVPTGTDNGDLKFFSSEGQTVGEKPGPRLIVQYSSLGSATNATLLDDFTTKHYEMNTGTKMWTGGWVEVGDDGKPGNGKIEISGGLLVVPDSANCSIYRSANLSGATAAAFEFNLTTNPLDSFVDLIAAQASSNGGASWVTLLNMTKGTPLGVKSFDLLSSLGSVGPNTLIRFIRLAGGSAGKKITLDNVKITFTTPNGATTATSLLAGSAVVSGTKDVEVKMTVTSSVSATVTPPAALTLAATGTASAALISGPTPSSGSASSTGTVFSYQYRITSGSGIGSVRFSGVPAGPAGFSFAVSQSQSVLTTAPLSFQATVNTPAPVLPITNVATLGDVGGLSQTSPTATTATTATVGDMVWADLDGNGSQGSGEPGLAGVAVRVFADADQNGAPDGPALSATVTDAAGRYRLYGLAAGSFVVGYDFSSVLPRSLPTTPLWHAVTLAEFEQNSTADFGIRPPLPVGDALQVSIGGRAWLDADVNAADDSAEPGISSIPVRIYADMNLSGTVDLADALIASAIADASGNHLFNGLHAAAYLVDADESSPALSAGLQLAAGGAAPATGLQAVSPASGTSLLSVSFGYQYASSISGMVFRDADLDGTADPVESGAAGAVVLLYLDANGNGLIDSDEYALADTTSGPAGLYTFTRLAPSAYIVVVDDSTVRTEAGVTGLMVATTSRERAVTLGPLQALASTDIGFTEAAVLRGHVFADANANGRRDLNEAGLPAVAVTISGTPFMGGSFNATVDTAVLGQWSAIVPPGNYVVSYAAADPDIPAGLATATTPFDYAISAGSGETWADLDFGRDHTGTIQVIVFTDADSSGSQQAGEAGLTSVPVHLYSTEAAPLLLATLLTDASGRLSFTGLAGGDYTVMVDSAGIPAAYHAVPTADPDATKDGSHTVSLTVSGTAPQLSFGYATIALNHSISGVVFEDTDLSGAPALPAEGRGGISVTAAVDADQNGSAEQVLTMLTAPDGSWSFAGIAANARVTISIDSSSLPSLAWVAVADPDAVVDQQTTIASINADAIGRNFGYVQKFGSVSGRIVTGNGNGVADPTETGHATVGLLFVYAGKDGIIGTADDSNLASVTNVTGEYTRSGLIPGFYQITKNNPAGYRGQMDADGGNPDIIQLAVVADQTLTGQDFEIELSPITGRVFADTNGNGGQDPEEPNLGSREFFITDGSGTRSLTTGFDGSWSTTVQPGLPCYITVPIGPGFNYQTNLNDSHSEVGVPPVMEFYNGSFGGTIAPGSSLLVMLQVPSEAVRMRLIGTHSDSVAVRVNAGADPGPAGSAMWASTGVINSLLSTPISAAPAPWQPGAVIYIRLVNTGTTPQPASIVSDGRAIATDDEDADGLPDAWETTHYGDPANGGGQSDPDFDGMDSLIEFLYGTSPMVPNGSEVPGSLVTTETSTTLTLVFNRPAVLPPGLQLAIERSPNLEPNSWESVSQLNADGTWTVPGILTETAAAAGRVSTTATILQEGTSAHRMFYRLSLRAIP